MALLTWDDTGKKVYETGIDRGVLYLANSTGKYDTGFAWNGLTGVTESPSGAESNKQYADNIVYLNLQSAEEFNGTIEAFTYPEAFAQCDGTATPQAGVHIGQQGRRPFGFAYRTKIGNDVAGQNFGYKLHLIYGALASPSEKAYTTVNDSPEATPFSWDLSTTPVNVGVINGVEYKPTATMVIDSTKVNAAKLADLEQILYGTPAVADDPATTTVNESKPAVEPRLPLPSEVVALFAAA